MSGCDGTRCVHDVTVEIHAAGPVQQRQGQEGSVRQGLIVDE